MTNGPSVEAVALASKAYEDAPCGEDAGERHDWVNALARAVDAHTEALRTRLAACEEALRFAAHVLNNQVLKADSVLFQDAKDKVNAALKEPSRGN